MATPIQTLLRIALLAAMGCIVGCSQSSQSNERPRLLSAEAARIENVSALERMGIALAAPMPARFVEIEPCAVNEFVCSSQPKNADRID